MKKIGVVISALLVGVSSYSMAASVDNAQRGVQEQLQQLRQEIDQMKNDQDQHKTSYSNANTDLLGSVYTDNDAPFAKYSSSRLPFSFHVLKYFIFCFLTYLLLKTC